MPVNELQAKQGNVDIILEIAEKGDVREFEKFGKTGKVCNCIGKDTTGQVKMTLWNEDIDLVNQGDKVHITNGWVSEWQGELQLSTGKFGKIEVVGKADAETVDEAIEEDVLDNPPQSDVGEHILTDDEKDEKDVLDTLDKTEGLSEEKPASEAEVTPDEIVEEKILDDPEKEMDEMDSSDMTEDEKEGN